MDFVNSFDEGQLIYNSSDGGAFYFGQKWITKSDNTYYSIRGFRFRGINEGNTYYLGTKVGTIMPIVDNNPHTDGYTYSLWKVTFDALITQLEVENSNINFGFLYDGTSSTDFYFDARVTWYDKGNLIYMEKLMEAKNHKSLYQIVK